MGVGGVVWDSVEYSGGDIVTTVGCHTVTMVSIYTPTPVKIQGPATTSCLQKQVQGLYSHRTKEGSTSRPR